MLLCNLDDVTVGMTVAAAVLHPRRPDLELLSPGVVLDESIIARLRYFELAQLWVNHDATADLDHVVAPNLTKARVVIYQRLKQDLHAMANQTISCGQVVEYRQAIMDLVCELIASRTAALTDELFAMPGDVFTHGANVAYLAVLTGLELETYVVHERGRLPVEHARDLTSLGVGAMLHDIGKAKLDEHGAAYHDANATGDGVRPDGYEAHCVAGYQMLCGSRAPASARQCVLGHHQRFDGRGFPDMAKVTRQRRIGPQAGRDIHIFCRIVAVANALDNLMRDASDGRRPVVAALHDLANDRFDGWFDPAVRDAVLRKVPPFAIGTQVRLSDGRSAVVIAPNVQQPCRPTVRLLTAATDRTDALETLDLEQCGDVSIVTAAGRDVTPWLFTMTDRPAMALAK